MQWTSHSHQSNRKEMYSSKFPRSNNKSHQSESCQHTSPHNSESWRYNMLYHSIQWTVVGQIGYLADNTPLCRGSVISLPEIFANRDLGYFSRYRKYTRVYWKQVEEWDRGAWNPSVVFLPLLPINSDTHWQARNLKVGEDPKAAYEKQKHWRDVAETPERTPFS